MKPVTRERNSEQYILEGDVLKQEKYMQDLGHFDKG